jgi:L-alanine-DL-glutamate epimerase-like enolase superfamily enzyme
MAEAWHLPAAPHDCTGPVVFTASTHLSLNATNALIQESVRGYYNSWYSEVVTAIPVVENGFVTVPEGPGLGCELSPNIHERFSVTRRVSQ